MKRIVEINEGQGLESLLGERVVLYCCRYIYCGKLIGVNHDCVLLTNCGIVYETGPLDAKKWTDYQPLPHDWFIQKSAIESFGLGK